MKVNNVLVQLSVIVGVVFCLYLPSVINNGYNLDDSLVTQNHRLTSKGFSAIPNIFSSPYYQDDQGYAYGYRPIVLVSFAIEHGLFGESPKIGHFVNLLLYVSICSILLLLLKKLFPQSHNWSLIFAVMVFAVHPLHTEVVCSLKNRDILLSSFFSINACWIIASFEQKKLKAIWVVIYALMTFGAIFSSLSSIGLLLIIFPFISISRWWLGGFTISLIAATNLLLVLRGTNTHILFLANSLIVSMVVLAKPIMSLIGEFKERFLSAILAFHYKLRKSFSKLQSHIGKRPAISTVLIIVLLIDGFFLLRFVVKKVPSPSFNLPHSEHVVVDPRDRGWSVSKNYWSDRGEDFVEYPIGLNSDLTVKFGTSFRVLGQYIYHIIIPYPMAFYYGYNTLPLVPISNPLAILSLLSYIAMLWAFIFFFYHSKIVSFGFGVYLFSIGLFSNLAEPVLGLFADRFTFLATIGSSTLLSVAFFAATKKFFSIKRWVHVLMGITLVGYAYLTVERAALWKDSLTLMRADILHVPNSAQAHNLLGNTIMKHYSENESHLTQQEKEGLAKEAHLHFQQAYTIYPQFFNALVDDGRVLQILGNDQAALEPFAKAYNIDSSYVTMVEVLAYTNQRIGKTKDASRYFEQLLRLTPDAFQVYDNYSFMLYSIGRFKESIAINKLAIAQNPSWTSPYKNIARIEQETGISLSDTLQ